MGNMKIRIVSKKQSDRVKSLLKDADYEWIFERTDIEFDLIDKYILITEEKEAIILSCHKFKNSPATSVYYGELISYLKEALS